MGDALADLAEQARRFGDRLALGLGDYIRQRPRGPLGDEGNRPVQFRALAVFDCHRLKEAEQPRMAEPPVGLLLAAGHV
jgi:hypothetical protein